MSARRITAHAGLALALFAAGCARPAAHAPAAFDPDSVPDAYARASAVLEWPGATRAFEIDEQGALFNGLWRVAIAPAADGVPATPPRRIAALDRWRPVLRWNRRAGDVIWEFEAVAFPEPPPRDTGLVVSLLVRERNLGATPRAVSLELALAPPPRPRPFAVWDGYGGPGAALAWAGAPHADTVLGWAEGAGEGATWLWRGTLAPGEARTHRFLLPAYASAARALARWARVSHARRVADALAQWDRWLGEGATFSLGDPATEAALRAANVVLLACRERRGARWVPLGGPLQYRDVWLRDGARLVAALAISGHGEIARELVAGLADFQWPNGAFLSQRGQLDGTGQALWAFEQVFGRAPASAASDTLLESGLRAWRWLERQRTEGRAGPGRFGAMLPFADPRDGELVRAQLVGDDAWAIAGERGLAHLLRRGGRAREADSVAASADAYDADFRAALERSGSADVPPSWQGVGRDWGNLAAGWPCGALATDDPRLARLARRVWAESGGAGLVHYGSRDSLHAYLGADLGTWALLAGRRAPADSVLAALLEWRDATGAAGELFSLAGDFGDNLPPHPTSAAALVTLVRNAVLFDDADTLRLTLGARERWWRGARIARAPTWWGPLDIAFERRRDEASWSWTTVPVWTALTLPPGTRLAAPPAPPLRAGGRPDVVLAPPGTREAHVRVVAVAR